MKLLLVIATAAHLCAQSTPAQSAGAAGVPAAVHLKALRLVEASGMRGRLAATMSNGIEQGKAAMQKQCPDCQTEFMAEWGKRMAARFKADDYVALAVRAHEKRFTEEELTDLLAVVESQKSEKPVRPSTELQKKLMDVLPALLGEIVGGSTELGAKLGAEVAAEIEKEHPEYTRPKPKPEQR